MWFKELYELWKKDNSLTQAVNDSHQMLEQTFEMFRASVKSLRESDNGDIAINVYEKDQVVNQYIRDVRKKVFKYLAVTGSSNLIPGLILTSIVIDIERIGDYTKNITDLAVGHPRRLDGGDFEEDYGKIEAAVSDIFAKLIVAVKDSDRASAKSLIKEHYWVLKRCDEIVDIFIRDENAAVSSRDAATRVLYARYLKRIAAHLTNIASSVVNPFERIGFRPENGDEAVL